MYFFCFFIRKILKRILYCIIEKRANELFRYIMIEKFKKNRPFSIQNDRKIFISPFFHLKIQIGLFRYRIIEKKNFIPQFLRLKIQKKIGLFQYKMIEIFFISPFFRLKIQKNRPFSLQNDRKKFLYPNFCT